MFIKCDEKTIDDSEIFLWYLGTEKSWRLSTDWDYHARNKMCFMYIKSQRKHSVYSGLLKIRTPKNPDFCVFAKQGLSKKSGLLCSRQTGLVLKIRTYDLADMELFKISGTEAHFLYYLTWINGFFKRSV